MFRARLAAVVVSGSLMMLSGCMQWGCGPSLFNNPFATPVSHDCCDPCGCGSSGFSRSSQIMMGGDSMTSMAPPGYMPSTNPLPSTGPKITTVPGATQNPWGNP